MLPRDCQDIERCEMRRFAPRFHIELCAHAPDELSLTTFRGKHPGQKKQTACLYRFHISAERLRRRRERAGRADNRLDT